MSRQDRNEEPRNDGSGVVGWVPMKSRGTKPQEPRQDEDGSGVIGWVPLKRANRTE